MSTSLDLHERARWIFQHLPQNIDRLLDAGCHDGASASRFTACARFTVGADVDVPALVAGSHRYVGPTLVAGSVASLPFADAVFDCVVFSEVLEHVPASAERQCIAELRRVMRPRGTLLLTTPHRGAFWWLDPLMGKTHVRRLFARLVAPLTELKGHKHYRVGELAALLTPYFDILTLERRGWLLYPLAYWGHLLPFGLGRLSPLVRLWQWMMDYDYSHEHGDAAYNLCIIARAR